MDDSGPILDHFKRVWTKNAFFIFEGGVRPTLLTKSMSYGSWNHSDTRKRLGDESSSLDLRADKCDLSNDFAVECHLLLECDFAISRHTDMILS